MKTIENVYVHGSLSELGEYAKLSPFFAKVVEYILSGVDKIPAGKNVIDGDNAWVNRTEAQLVNRAEHRHPTSERSCSRGARRWNYWNN